MSLRALRRVVSVSTVLAGLLLPAAPAQAGLLFVSAIEVRNAVGQWIQISELVATETGTGTNLALASEGASGVASSLWPGSSIGAAMDGIAPAQFPQIYHSGGNANTEFLRITLAAPSELDSITIFGRTDCCSDRDVFNLTVFNAQGQVLFSQNNVDATGSNHQATVNLPHTPRNVPEPVTLTLVGLGLGACACSRRVARRH